tara:strand:+ start:5135 stop:5914 length:780 start_codon:yes stop_codon:yes gene_type:complete
MATETVEALVNGGKASAAPPLGPALGPLGVNIGEVITAINDKTKSFDGMQVPIKLHVDTDSKEFDIEVGTPPSSALIKKEAHLEKGSGNPLADKVADLLIEQIIKIAKMKEDDLLGKTLQDRVKEVIGTCNSMGVLVEGVQAKDAITKVNDGEFEEEIRTEKTELSAEEQKHLEEERKKLAAEIEKRRAHFEKVAKKTIEEMKGKARGEIKTKLVELKIPLQIIDELLPVEGAADGEGKPAEAAAPAEGDAPAEEEKKE